MKGLNTQVIDKNERNVGWLDSEVRKELFLYQTIYWLGPQ